LKHLFFFSKRNRLCEQLEPVSKISLDKQKLGKCVANDQGLKTERTIFLMFQSAYQNDFWRIMWHRRLE